MNHQQIFSRRDVERKVDFRPDNPDGDSPYAQLRRLSVYMASNVASADNITDCPDALDALREYVYRKTFTGTTHEQFLETDATDPEAIDWLLSVASIEAESYRSKTDSRKQSR
jgi:hypothetical protein